jgi:hypothetical protein
MLWLGLKEEITLQTTARQRIFATSAKKSSRTVPKKSVIPSRLSKWSLRDYLSACAGARLKLIRASKGRLPCKQRALQHQLLLIIRDLSAIKDRIFLKNSNWACSLYAPNAVRPLRPSLILLKSNQRFRITSTFCRDRVFWCHSRYRRRLLRH